MEMWSETPSSPLGSFAVMGPPGVAAASAAAAPRPAPGPTLRLERRCWQAGDGVVCGIDEVGRGAWAGPVTVAAVVPPPRHLRGVRDSKELTREERERAGARVRGWAAAIGVGHASHDECDELGLTGALRAAGRRALSQLVAQGYEPDRVILDGKHDYLGLGPRVTTVVKADASSLAVAAASCVAKVTRDAMMREEADHYPPYGFESNVGYPAPVHKAALAGYGPSAIHRRSWIFMEGLCWRGVPPPRGRLFL
jgi:ribonuclease HII